MKKETKLIVFIVLLGVLALIFGVGIAGEATKENMKKVTPAICVASPPEHTLNVSEMIFSEDEAESLLQRFEDERKAEAEAKALREAAKATERYSESNGTNRFYLAAVVCQEVGNMDTQLMMMVANVVMNRVASPLFPNTIYGVLTQKWQYGMMWRDGIGFPRYASESMKRDAYEVADRILAGERVLPSNVVFQAEFPQGSGTHAYYPVPYGLDLYFCYE